MDAGFWSAAGSGFVVRERNGSARLRFERAGAVAPVTPWWLAGPRFSGLTMRDHSRVILADAFGSGEVLGLDATTGQQLWRSADSDSYGGGPGREGFGAPMTAGSFTSPCSDGDALTRIDSRPRPCWTRQVPGEFGAHRHPKRIDIWIDWSPTGQAEVRYVSLDPSDGAHSV